MRKIAVMAVAALSLVGGRSEAQFPAAPGTGPGLAETIEAIESARVTTRILYITAHPDDESGAVLTYLARGLHADVALLSLTRGEGGQNALGPEQAPQLGLIRTQELLAATRGYGVKLYFTRAKDFGFSKTPEETEKIWGDQVLADMVYVLRDFRPNIVINNWGGVHGGHGHHQAAGLLTPTAVDLARDATYKKSGCDGCMPWSVSQILDLERGSEHPQGYVLPLDEISPLYGRSYRQIGLDAFANHRTQGITGFVSSPFFLRPVALRREDGKPFDPSSLAVGIAGGFSGCQSIQALDKELERTRAAVLQLDWKTAGESVGHAASVLEESARKCNPGPNEARARKQDYLALNARLEQVARLVAGVDIRALADRNNLSAGEKFHISVRASCRQNAGCEIENSRLVSISGFNESAKTGDLSKGLTYEVDLDRSVEPAPGVIGSAAPITFQNENHAEPFAYAQVWVSFRLGQAEFVSRDTVKYADSSSTHANLVPLRIVPAYTLAVVPKQEIEKLAAKHEPFDVFLRVHSHSQKTATVKVGLDVPAGWKSSDVVELSFAGEGDRYAKLTVTPPAKLEAGHCRITAYAKRGEEKFATSIEPLPSMPTLTWEEPAQTVVHAFNIKVPEHLRVGYISAESEPVPDALKLLGIQVDLLDANALNFGDLSNYDAIVVGVRAYELRSELPGANQRLLDYATNGGTLVVQYERDFAWDGKNYAPYPAKIANKQGDPLPRVTDENSPVKFLKPDEPLLNTPNKITEDDFKGWMQERGLYFWSEYDPRYTALLAMNDPGEKDLVGSLVYTKYGKGTYIYTGLAFFRQLPEGVPGAYRLFVNLLAASRSH